MLPYGYGAPQGTSRRHVGGVRDSRVHTGYGPMFTGVPAPQVAQHQQPQQQQAASATAAPRTSGPGTKPSDPPASRRTANQIVTPPHTEVKDKIPKTPSDPAAERTSSPPPVRPPNSIPTSFADEVGCGVCVDVLNDPVTLDCGHNVCSPCAQRLFEYSKPNAKGTNVVITCPVCRGPTNLARTTGVATLSRNANLRRVLERLKAARLKESREAMCGLCEQVSAELECEQCQAPLCGNCSDYLHQKGAYRTHNVVTYGRLDRRKKKLCSDHAKDLDLYCTLDEVIVCSHCLLVGAHQRHECISLLEAAKQAKAAVSEAQDLVATRKSQLESAKGDIQSVLPAIENAYSDADQQLHLRFAELRSKLDQREQQLRLQLSETKEFKLQKLVKQIEVLAVAIGIADEAIDSSGRLLQKTDDFEIVRMKQLIDTKIAHLNGIHCDLVPCDSPDFTMEFKSSTEQDVTRWGYVGKADDSDTDENYAKISQERTRLSEQGLTADVLRAAQDTVNGEGGSVHHHHRKSQPRN